MLWQNVWRVWTKSKNVSNWVSDIKDKLLEIGLGHIWAEQDKICYKSHFLLIKQRIIDNFVQNLIADINSSSRCMLYRNIIDLFHFNIIRWNYFRVLTKTTVVSKIRISSLNLAIDMDDIEIFWVIPEYVNFADPKLRMSITLS